MSRAVVFKGAWGMNCTMGREPSPGWALEPHQLGEGWDATRDDP
jgi:hypothetical protein